MAATLRFRNGLEISAWGRNVADNHYITTVFSSVAPSGSLSGYSSQPVTYGGTVRPRFEPDDKERRKRLARALAPRKA